MKQNNVNKTSLYEKIQNNKFNMYKWKYLFFTIPLVIILVGIILISTIDFNKGIDFTGGTVMSVVPKDMDMNVEADYDDAKTIISGVVETHGITVSYFQTAETDNGTAIQFRYQDLQGKTETEMNTINDSIREELFSAFNMTELENSANIQSAERIGATASSNLLKNAFIAILVSVVLILIYIAFRFEFASGISAIVALLSDVLVTCSFVLMFRIQINSAFVAALITIIGYSINNTIIIFDRIRGNRKQFGTELSSADLAAKSVKETLIRTINTTITTLLAVVLLAIIGVSSIREFVIPIIIGLLAGTYSSVFVAPNLWALMYKTKNTKKKSSAKA